MLRIGACKRAARTLGAAVLAAFLFGSASGPLRTCQSHPGHSPGSYGAQAAAHHDHAAAPTGASETSGGHEGCSCLGRCSLQQAPYLPGADLPVASHLPVAPRTLAAPARWAHVTRSLFDLPLARPPPAVV